MKPFWGELLQVPRPLDSFLTMHSCSLSAPSETSNSLGTSDTNFCCCCFLFLTFYQYLTHLTSLTRTFLYIHDEPRPPFFFFFNHLDCLAKEMRQDPKLATYFGILKWWQKAVTLHGTDVTSCSMLQDGRWKHWCPRLNYNFVWEENCTFPCLFFSVQLEDFNMPSSIFYHFAV